MRATLVAVGGAGLVALLGVLVALALAWRTLSPVDPSDDTRVRFEIESGATLARVARDLEAAGLVRSERAVRYRALYRGLAERLRAGEFALTRALSTDEILDRIAEGRVMTYAVVVPEGIRASEIAVRLEEAGLVNAEEFLKAAFDPDLARRLGVEGESLEGYLFPETYRLARGLAASEIAGAMVEQFHAAWREVEGGAQARGLSMRETVTLASIVEKETAAPAERPLIAAVFLNRLARGMRLETDPTVIYGIPDFDGNLKKRHLLDDTNPYNTYRHTGLPPGPIASPGAAALRAVVEPAASDYLYFVSMNDGTHKFSRSYREHVEAVNRFQKRRRRVQ